MMKKPAVMRFIIAIAVALSLATGLYAGDGSIPLKKPPKSLKTDLVRALVARKSITAYKKKPVTVGSLSVLLWSAAGVTKPKDGKPLYGLDNGSGATVTLDRKTVAFPFEADCIDLYVLLEKTGYRYEPVAHKLVAVTNGDQRRKGGTMTAGVPVVLVLVADLDRFPFFIARKERLFYAHTVAGAMLQNIALVSPALGLGQSPYSEINHTELINVLKLKPQQAALFLVTVGYPPKN